MKITHFIRQQMYYKHQILMVLSNFKGFQIYIKIYQNKLKENLIQENNPKIIQVENHRKIWHNLKFWLMLINHF